jgi:sulfate adenylyltransferase subunit 2
MDRAATLRTSSAQPTAPPEPGRPAPGRGSVTALVRPYGRPLGHLDLLESLAIFIIREVAAESERPVLLFSGGKDSAVLLHLAAKAFKPAKIPFPVLHVDTGHNFSEVLEYRDAQVKAEGARLIVAKVQDSIDRGRVADPGPNASRNRQQTATLLDAIQEHGFDAAFGGARRDEDKARAKERVLSFRDSFGQWDPKRQRPELWQLYQGTVRPGEHLRAFPLSDWTELDVWQYIRREGIALPSIYYAHERTVISRDGMLLAVSEWVTPQGNEEVEVTTVRYRTVGDATLTGAVRSHAATADDIIHEIASSRISERGATRGDDRFSETAMEDRKREGYF